MTAVVVVVLSWNKQNAVIDCIGRIKTLSGADIHVVVVDNGSADDSVDAIRRAHPDVTVLGETVNRGYVGGVNRGLAEADRRGADFAWLLNDDTTFDGSVLSPLLAQAGADPRCGLITPVLVDLGPEGKPQFVNGLVDWHLGSMGHNFRPEVHAERVARGAAPIVPGTALLCAMRLYRAIGPFDERFFAYWEDTDYSIRAARAGFSISVVETALVGHAAPMTTERPPHYHYYMTRNEALFWRLHSPGRGAMRWKRRWLAASLDAIGRERDLGHGANVDAIIDGIWHAWTRRGGMRASDSPAPLLLSRLLGAAPYLLSSAVRGELRGILMRLLRIGREPRGG